MHPVTMSGFDSLILAVTKITGATNFLEELAQIKPTYLSAKKEDRVIRDPAATWAHLGKVFALRHILCHELAAELQIGEAETRGLLITCQQFMVASAQWFEKLEHPHPPPSREERLKQARESRMRAAGRLNSQLSIFESEKTLPDDAKTAVKRAAKKLGEYQKSLEDAFAAINRFPYSPSPYDEEQNLRESAEAMNALSSRIKLCAMYLGIGEYRGLHEDDE
jgi:hypothetical protein